MSGLHRTSAALDAMGATSVCEKCGRAIAAGAALYSTAGELICPSCNQAAVTVELEQRGQVALRRGRIVLGVVIAVVVLVPTAMFLAGLGQKMGEVMMALGGGCVFGAAIALRIFLRKRMFPAAHIGALVATEAGTLETGPVVMVDGTAQAKFTRAVVRFTQAVVKSESGRSLLPACAQLFFRRAAFPSAAFGAFQSGGSPHALSTAFT